MFWNRLKRTAVLSLFALVIGAGIGYWQIQKNNARIIHQTSQPIEMAGVDIGGPYELINQDGAVTTHEDFLGQYKLIYFGFTYCPAICPTELQKITKVLNELGPLGDNIQPLFISVDPERDTAELMREYVSLFHPRLVGLTGSREQIDNVMKAYRVYARRVDDPDLSDYTMDHSSFIYLMGPDDNLLTMYRIKDSVDFVVADIRSRLAAS